MSARSRLLPTIACLVLHLNLLAQSTPPLIVPTQTAPVRSAPAPATATPINTPVPGQITTAHTVFLANAGNDAAFPIASSETYSTIYQALHTWGRYRLIATPQEADLIFTLRGVDPLTLYGAGRSHVYPYTSPAYELVITDTHSAVPLWTIDSPVDLAGGGNTRARWQAISVTNLVSRLKLLTGENLSSQETADLTTVPKHHLRLTLAIVAGAAILGGVLAVSLIFRNYGKNQQDAFCKANNIPPSQCAGG